MANRRSESNRKNARSRLASFLLVLLPGFMFLGLLAPGAVTVEYEGEEETIVPVSFRNFRVTRRPMISARDKVASGVDLASLQEALASGVRFVAEGARRALDLPKVQSDGDDSILLDDEEAVEQPTSRKIFASSMDAPVLAVDLTPVWNRRIFDIIPHNLDRRGYSQFDDFPGDSATIEAPLAAPVPVPEPQSGALVGLGLALLALARRRG